MRDNRSIYTAVFLTLTALISFAAYHNTLSNGFVSDDYELIVANPWITDVRNMARVFSSHTMGYCETCPPISYRPMIFLVYTALYALAGLKPAPYHLVNLLIHAVNGMMVFFTVRLLLSRHGAPEGSRRTPFFESLPAFAASALFVSHPAGSEPVSWISSVAELSYTLLGLSAFYLYLKGEGVDKRGLRGASYLKHSALPAFLVLAALAFKETAVILPVLFILYDAIVSSRERPFVSNIKRYPPLAAAAALYLVVRAAVLGNLVSGEKFHSYPSFLNAALNALVLFSGYLKMLFFPVHLYPGEPFSPVDSVSDARVILAFVSAAVIAALIFAFRRKASRLYLLSFSMIALPLLPALYTPAVSRAPLADRYLYFPLAGFSLLAALLFKGALGMKMKDGKGGRLAVVFALAALMAAVAAFSYVSARKNLVWKDEVTYWGTQARVFPGNYFALYRVGKAYIRNNMPEEGISRMKESVRLNLSSRNPDPMVLLLSRKVLAVEYRKNGMLDEAVREYEEIVRMSPEDISAIFNLASIYRDKGMFTDAVELFKRALILAGEPWQTREIYNALGDSFALQGLYLKALDNYLEALNISPEDPVTLNKASNARRMLGRTD